MKRFQLAPLHRDLGMHTRYTAVNIALLLVGVLLCVFNFSYTGLILASIHTPAKGWNRIGVDFIAVLAALAVIAMVVGFRWPKIASTVLWTLTFFWFMLAVAVHLFPVMVIPAALSAIGSAVASVVEHFSGKPVATAIEGQR